MSKQCEVILLSDQIFVNIEIDIGIGRTKKKFHWKNMLRNLKYILYLITFNIKIYNIFIINFDIVN